MSTGDGFGHLWEETAPLKYDLRPYGDYKPVYRYKNIRKQTLEHRFQWSVQRQNAASEAQQCGADSSVSHWSR